MRTFRDLEVWRFSYELTRHVYRATTTFPAEERYALASQMRRAAVSIVSNIAEGAGRSTPGEQANSLSTASGSSSELECQLMIARNLGYMDPAVADDLIRRVQRIRRMLWGLTTAVKSGRVRNMSQ